MEMIYTYCGENIETLGKEELIKALIGSIKYIEFLREDQERERRMQKLFRKSA